MKFRSLAGVIIFVVAVLFFPCLASAQTTTYLMGTRQFKGPMTYKDPGSGIIFNVESDGRHVSAVDPRGKVLWRKDPFADAHLEFYRMEPKIVFIGPLNEWMTKAFADKGNFIAITFNSTQFGVLNIATGEFTCEGND